MNYEAPIEPTAIATLNGIDLAKPLPAVKYVIAALGMSSGAPTLIAGHGYTAKTLTQQSVLIAEASGKAIYGVWNSDKGPVLHLDFEQGLRVTQERYQRLAIGMGVNLASLADDLRLAVYPDVRLDSPGAEDVYARACDGRKLVLVDSLRASAPSGDENSSEIRQYLDLLGRVSEKTGACVIVIHHMRKPQADDAGGKFRIRGSSALFDACGSVFTFDAAKGKPTIVLHEKCRNTGITIEPFCLRVSDVTTDDGNARGALRVTHEEYAQHVASERTASAERNREVTKADAESLRKIVAEKPRMGERELRAELIRHGHKWGRDRLGAAKLEAELVNLGTEKKALWYLNS